MSGNFTQRGETSIINKWEKANLAVENGIDLVIELPTIYSISSAENFAMRSNKNTKLPKSRRLPIIWNRNRRNR